MSLTSRNLFRFAITVFILFLAFDVYAASGGDEEVFKKITDKIIGWIDGGLGKMLVVISLVIGVFMGVMGFKIQQILIPIGLGLLLMSVKLISGLFF